MQQLKNKVHVVLASTSPRRFDLMTQVGIQVQIIPPEVDETPLPKENASELVRRLSLIKAQSVANLVKSRFERSLTLAADTVVVAPGGQKILGKPISSTDAKRMLRLLSGKTHSVYTGYCIISNGIEVSRKRIIRVVHSKVKMRRLTAEAINNYVSSGEPLDKAGSYGAQGLGTALIEKITGSYTNVVGLPMCQVLEDFEKNFKFRTFSWIE